jgi:hypothetical protein
VLGMKLPQFLRPTLVFGVLAHCDGFAEVSSWRASRVYSHLDWICVLFDLGGLLLGGAYSTSDRWIGSIGRPHQIGLPMGSDPSAFETILGYAFHYYSDSTS